MQADRRWPGKSLRFALALAAAATRTPAAEPPALLLAERYRGDLDVSRYWVSENSMACAPVGMARLSAFAAVTQFPPPQWLVEALPKQPLDGELWLGRGSFDQLSSIVRRESPDDAEWRHVRNMIFELPNAGGGFSERAEQIRAVTSAANLPWLQAITQFRLSDAAALQKKLRDIVRSGGEGLMLHREDAAYETGRSSALLKPTPWQDAEASVVAHLPGKGKYAGMAGALRMELPDGRRFSLGSGLTDVLRRNSPPVGTLVTYRYRELTQNGMPRFPRYLRVRDRHLKCSVQSRKQGLVRLRRGAPQQDSRHPASRIRTARRGVPSAQSPYLHAAENPIDMHFPTLFHEDP